MRPDLHPACAVFPTPSEKDIQELANDIKHNGLIEPITLTPNGLILDGKVRWSACETAGIEPRTVTYEGDDPIAFVLSKNKHRRHLSVSQKAMTVARLANLQNGSNQYELKKVDHFDKVTHSTKSLAKQSGVASSTIDFARTVLRAGEPHIIAMVDAGEVAAAVAATAVRSTSRNVQAAWTRSDVVREGRKIINAYPSNQQRAAGLSGGHKSRTKPSGQHDIPYKPMVWPTKEELEYPADDAPLSEFNDFFKKYGRTPLHPKAIKEMLDADGLSSSLAISINSTTNDRLPDAEKFFECIDRLLSHMPEPGKTNGGQTDFAGKARKTLAMLEKALPKALALLTALDAKLRDRKADRGEKTPEVRLVLN